MKASTYIKSHGLPSLVYVAKLVGKHPNTVQNWFDNNFDLVKYVTYGILLEKKLEEYAMTVEILNSATVVSQEDAGKFAEILGCVSKGTDDE